MCRRCLRNPFAGMEREGDAAGRQEQADRRRQADRQQQAGRQRQADRYQTEEPRRTLQDRRQAKRYDKPDSFNNSFMQCFAYETMRRH